MRYITTLNSTHQTVNVLTYDNLISQKCKLWHIYVIYHISQSYISYNQRIDLLRKHTTTLDLIHSNIAYWWVLLVFLVYFKFLFSLLFICLSFVLMYNMIPIWSVPLDYIMKVVFSYNNICTINLYIANKCINENGSKC